MSTIIARSTDAQTIEPELVLHGWQSDDEPQSRIHIVLGREYPDITLRPAQARTGTLRLLFVSAEAAEIARVFHRAPAVFTATSDLPWVPAAYVPTGTIRTMQQAGARWVLEVPFQEVAP
ncbi:hypothetical protein FVO59_12775 [Microbacterium esteraromaticum]|uniref:Uncharacterized protein n=1 Tax=Microbacterium esteraromaticum TaxID=57043 RepID=A0A7D7WFB4_9MICO|nr:hypothetical protein [Microbacterium esteraromaticum]QMU97977.1 hypothetical protein FVO59_12775 [Microbacterium esteraromaticum]